MVNKPREPDGINELAFVPCAAKGTIREGRLRFEIAFSPKLADKIRTEATLRGWSFGRMVRHLCEAAIDGIE